MKKPVLCLVILLSCVLAGSLHAQESWKSDTIETVCRTTKSALLQKMQTASNGSAQTAAVWHDWTASCGRCLTRMTGLSTTKRAS